MSARTGIEVADPKSSIAAELAKDFGHAVPRETVERCVSESFAELAKAARVTVFLPILAKRSARERLRDLTVTS